MSTASQRAMHSEQKDAALATVRAAPGLTAYQVSTRIPMPPPEAGELTSRHVPMTLVLGLLRELATDGLVYAVPNPRGQQFYPREDTSQ